jgi:RNA polymerase sigma factor (sigma-70 family)
MATDLGTGSENDMPTNGTCPGGMTAELIESVPDGDAFGITIRSRAYHADLLAAARKVGSVRAMAQHLGISESTLGGWIRLDSQPSLRGTGRRKCGAYRPGRWAEIERKLVELTGKGATQLWPGFLKLSGLLDAPKVREETREIPAGDMMRLRHQPQSLLPPPERGADLAEVRGALEKALEKLSFREREVLKLRYGLGGGGPSTLEEVGRVFKITCCRVRQIEAKAIHKLQGGARCAELARVAAAVFDLHPCPRCGLNVGHFSHCARCDVILCDRCVGAYPGGRVLCRDCWRKQQEAGWPEAPDY